MDKETNFLAQTSLPASRAEAPESTKKKIAEYFLDLFFPAFCLGCKKEGSYLCQDCKELLDILHHQYCLCSKNPLRLPAKNLKGKCNQCSDRRLSGIYFALSYKEKPLTRKLIHFLKYEPYYLKDLAKVTAELISDHLSLLEIPREILQEKLIVPVPIELSRKKRRGYNQSEEIAKELSKKLNIPLALGNLIKIKTTKPQAELSREERKNNLKDAFIVSSPEELRGRKILLLDDVYTTGSTMEECAKVLRKSGAKEVWGIAVARD